MGKSITTKGTTLAPRCARCSAGEYTKWEKSQLYGHFAFVTLVSFVVEKGFPVKYGGIKISQPLKRLRNDRGGLEQRQLIGGTPAVKQEEGSGAGDDDSQLAQGRQVAQFARAPCGQDRLGSSHADAWYAQ